MQRALLLLALLALAMMGCRPIAINISHAATDKGYLNSGLRELGQLYVFDSNDGVLTELAVLELTNQSRGATFARQVARDVKGVDVSANIDAATSARVKAEIQRNSFIELENAFDASYSQTFSDLAAEINRREATGEDVGFTWFLDEAVKPGSTLRYLLVYSTIRADVARVGYANVTDVGGGLKVPIRGAGDVDVEVKGLSEESFQGSEVPVLVDYHVIQASLSDAGFYRFRVDRAFTQEKLSNVLKGRVHPESEPLP